MGRSIGTSIPELYRSVDENGIILDCNHAYADRLEYSVDDVIGMSFLDHTPERNRDVLRAGFEDWKRTKVHAAGRTILMTASGEEFEVMVTADVKYDRNMNLVGRYSIMREIAHLEEMRNMYNVAARDGYEHPYVMHRSVNYNGIIIDCNQTYLDKLGYTKEEVIGVSLLRHTAEKSKYNLGAHMENWRNGMRDTAKIWMLKKDGGEFPVSLIATDERDAKGALVGRTVALKPLDE